MNDARLDLRLSSDFTRSRDHAAALSGERLRTSRIDDIWIKAAAQLGFEVVRTPDAYASTDGRGRIFVGIPETLDCDDSVAQLVLHELCHALVQGESSLCKADWGLDNTNDADRVREDACLRVQAALADSADLRVVMTPTTVTKADYVCLAADPIACLGTDAREAEACELARAALTSSLAHRWLPPLRWALDETARALADEEPRR